MAEIFSFDVKDIVIAVLFLIVAVSFLNIRHLKKKLLKEVRARKVPVLLLDIDLKGEGMFLENTSQVAAKDIIIEDLTLPLNCDFKKEVVFRFDPIAFISAQEKVKIKFKVYDGDFQLATEEMDNLYIHLSELSLSMHLTFSNLEDLRFVEDIDKKETGFFIKKIAPFSLGDPSRAKGS